MAAFYEGAFKLFSSDINSTLILIGLGFFICHLIHAIRYGFFGGGIGAFDKLKKFLKQLFFLKMGY